MNTYRDEDEDWDDEEADSSDDSADGEPTVPCPYCKAEILEDSPRCPSCERYLSTEDHSSPQKPLWVVATAVVCLAIAIWLAFAAF
jgi:uncharacterized paraquat-inducible protein A